MASAAVLPPASRWSVEASGFAVATFPICFTSAASSRRSMSSRGAHVHGPRCLPSSSDASTSTAASSSLSSFPSSSPETAGDLGRELPSSSLMRRTTTGSSSQLHTTSSAAGGLVGGGERAADSVAMGGASKRAGGQLSLPVKGFLKLFRKQPLWRRIFFASKKVRSVILLNVLTIIYASDIPVLKEVESIMDPALFTMVRFALSALPFLPFVLGAYQDAETRSAGIELGCWVSLGYLSQALGLLSSDAGRASFISAFTVGDVLNMLSAVFFGIHILRTEHISRVIKKEKYLSLLGYEVIVIAIFSVVWYFVRGFFSDVEELRSTSWSTLWDGMISFPWIPALYTGIFSTVLCLWAEMSAMCDVSATETAIIYGLEPLWGAAFAWILLGERWDTIGWIGAVLIFGKTTDMILLHFSYQSGSLTVQIFGSPPEKSGQDESSRQLDRQKNSEGSNDLTFSTVVVDSRKNVTNLPKK
ncbi:hypothetical protein Taro_053921 [Colocasia esculenta]|uniref:EamA domain-containing protein n=1 Tax=Colocasia esculenta TaxID=4460 RepID=A0A843XP19_COLES|nr:hypothetical protein [Colocasia esculenta]